MICTLHRVCSENSYRGECARSDGNAYKCLVGKPERMRTPDISKSRSVDNIKMGLEEVRVDVDWIRLICDRVQSVGSKSMELWIL